jgi:hypothetical protein
MEVEQVWQYGQGIGEPLYSFFVGDADWMETTGNVLVTFGGISHTGGVPGSDLGLGTVHTRIIEVDHHRVPREVFDLLVYDPDGAIAVYRSERIPNLYGRDAITSW